MYTYKVTYNTHEILDTYRRSAVSIHTKVIRVRFNGKYFFLISLLIVIGGLKTIIGMITCRNNCSLDFKGIDSKVFTYNSLMKMPLNCTIV